MFRNCCLLLVVLLASPAVSAEPSAPWAFQSEQLRPFWLSGTMYGESVLFVQETPDAPPCASLLLVPTRILSVTSSSGDVTYTEGSDYVWKPGTRQITLPPGSRIVCKQPEDLRREPGSQRHRLTHRDGKGEILFGATHEYHDMQTEVTYQFNPGDWTGPRTTYAGDRLPNTVKKLQEKQPLTIALLGDSISTGCNASGWAKVAPFLPPYQDLLAQNLRETYGGEVTLKNFAVGGTDTGWGLANIEKVIATNPDLVILAFGMNDSAHRPAKEYQANTRAMVEAVHKACPNAEFILIATMLGNKDWTTLHHELFSQYRDTLAELCGPGIVLADMTSLWDAVLQEKKDCDLTGNGVNHPNDFGHRLYGQVLSSLLIPSGR